MDPRINELIIKPEIAVRQIKAVHQQQMIFESEKLSEMEHF
jgi:hypothetical protein